MKITVTNEYELINTLDRLSNTSGNIYLNGTFDSRKISDIRKKRKRINYLSYRKCKSQRKYL